ncbi:TlpA family protein disulfide reductase [Mucilaginibacter terrenus]|uniref:TlpA family protein disulfide reductase n=1 Tax=Mucilaginibacter terrenus TaxID=2482727 RepID=A0A3E2NP08_9SPHI|nr:TlpA disulfide reductase family protein [Mucilaginibacter terrenus]RFZ82724.1 TlpA family protein disulfide reductase [Mucilaginibacter terrenus]
MRALLLSAAILLSLQAFPQSALRTDSVYISGKVNYFEKYKDSANAVLFYINDIVLGDELTLRVKINNDGTFKTAFLKTGTQDIYMEYNDKLSTIIVSPGDHMQLLFNAGDPEQTLSFKGSNSQTNYDLLAYGAAFDKESIRIYGAEPNARALKNNFAVRDSSNPDAYKSYVVTQFKADSAFLANYISAHALSPTFVNWAKADLKYRLASNLMRYPWLHPRYAQIKDNSFKVPDSYYKFVDQFPVNDPSQALTSNFNEYIAEYRLYLAAKELGKQYPASSAIALFARQPFSFSKDVLLCNAFYKLIHDKELEAVKQNLGVLEKNVTDTYFKNKVLAAYRQAAHIAEPLAASSFKKAISEGDSVLNNLTAKYRNKVIYIDFWGTWCSPCRAEMPYSKVLRAKFAGKDVVFLYLGVQSKEAEWKAMIKTLDIKGENVLLSNNQFSALSEKFQISGIPRYVLINKQGKVADGNARRPGDKLLVAEIQKLLAL